MARILCDTPSDTVIEDRPWMLGLFLSAGVLGGVALLFKSLVEGNLLLGLASAAIAGGSYAALSVAIRRVRLHIRSDGSATLTIRTHRGQSTRRFAPGTLRAGLQTSRTGGSETIRAVLLVDGEDGTERLPFTAYYAGSPVHRRIVERINARHRAAARTG